MLLKDICRAIDALCPFDTQEEWDNSGLQIGDPASEVKKVLVAFDFTEEILKEAIEKEVQLVVTHHPFFFKGIRRIDGSEAKGRMICGLIEHHIGLISCHTNLDKAAYGVSAVLGAKLGLIECRPFIAETETVGLGVIGTLKSETTLDAFAERVKKALAIPMVRTVGAAERKISRVAVMGGAGSDFMAEAKAFGADLYVTADLKYHDGQTAAEMGLSLMDAGHFATEVSVMEPFRQKMAAAMEGVEFLLAENVKDFWAVR